MRYKKSFTGYTSEVDYPEYFLSENGKYDPDAEMQKSIQKLQEPFSKYKDPNKHPACLFPGRYIYFNRIGKIPKKMNFEKCPDYDVFRKKLELHSVSVIFSSYFINKPASAFGHTLLKLNKEDPTTSDLKSYGVDFSAQVTTTNPIAYGVLGIIGGFYGRFSLLPYFLKLREYNDYESRDLWEFELNFEKDELELLVAHLWDMNLALFDYFYFTENCSYHITRFIDAIKPKWKLTEQLYHFVIPIDTLIPLVKKQGVTKSIYFRPSLQKRTQEQIDKLDDKQIRFVKDSTENLNINSILNIEQDKQVQALDTLIDFTDYKFPAQLHLEKSGKIQDFKREILIKRSNIPVNTKRINKIKRDDFNFAHLPRKFGVGYRDANQRGLQLRHRFSLHNVLEPQGDIYSKFSLEMGKTSLFFDSDREKFVLEQFEVANVEALRPLTILEKKLSWNINFGLLNRLSVISPFFNFGVGGSVNFLKQNFSLFVQSDNSHFLNQRRHRFNALGLNLQWLVNFDRFSMKANYKRMRDLVYGENNIEITQFALNKTLWTNIQVEMNFLKGLGDEQLIGILYLNY
jgi:hypothetical protein